MTGSPVRRLAREETRVPELDRLPGSRARAVTEELLYFETDGHHNAGGNAVLADTLYRFLTGPMEMDLERVP